MRAGVHQSCPRYTLDWCLVVSNSERLQFFLRSAFAFDCEILSSPAKNDEKAPHISDSAEQSGYVMVAVSCERTEE